MNVCSWPVTRVGLIALLGMAGCGRGVVPPRLPTTTTLDRPSSSLIETSRQAVILAPQSAAAWGRLGQAFHAAEFVTEARTCYAQAATLDGREPGWPHLLGLLEMQDDPEAGLRHLARAVELTGGTPDAPRVRLAQALVERGRYDEAEKQLRVLLAGDATHGAARLEQARIQLARGHSDAIGETVQACLTNPVTARPAMLLLSQWYQRGGRQEEATQWARRAAAMPRPNEWPDPYLRQVRLLRADRQKLEDQANQFLMQRRPKEAEAALARLLQEYPDNPEGLLLLGRLRYQEQKCAEAEAVFRRHLDAQPQSLNGHIQLGLALLCQQRWADAAAILRQAIVLKPDFAQAHYNLGLALSRAGDAAGAIASYRNALRSNPGDVNTHLSLAEALALGGQKAEASQHVERASAINPNDPRLNRLRELLR